MLFQDYVCSRDKEKEVAISNMPVPISQPGKWLPGNDLCWPRIKEMVDWLLQKKDFDFFTVDDTQGSLQKKSWLCILANYVIQSWFQN